ncbi:MAG TPA: substrate-binding domain-containing protein [Rhodopila sp.]|nr:substrate-binding domain-containing protein [Rhodopila sp.]
MLSRFKVVVLFLLATILLPRAGMADSLRIYAAGSLGAAFKDMISAFPAAPGAVAAPVFGASGLLREKIEQGAPADILASADMTQPRRLAEGHPGRTVILFTRNRICALARENLGLKSGNFLDRLLDPSVRLATSTPGADPSGDYTWAVFARAEAVHPGAQVILQAKAMKLMGGGALTPPLVPGHGSVQGIFLANRADVVFGYCSGFGPAMREVPGLVSVALPPALSVGADYGMVVLSDNPLADRFALFVMSEQGQAILQKHGFDAIGIAAP